MAGNESPSTVLQLAEQNEQVQAAMHQLWKEKERQIRLQKSVEWTPADWLEGRAHFEPIIQNKLRSCAALFEDRYDHDYRVYHYYDYDEDGWSKWRAPLRLCLFTSAHYERLREHVEQLEPALLANDLEENLIDNELHRWWVQSSLDSGHEKGLKE